MCRYCFDRCSNERCEGAGKTAVSWVCEILYSQSVVGVVGSQLFGAAGNTETGFSSIAFITTWQSFVKEGAQWLSGRVLDSRKKGRGFEPHRRHYVVFLSKNIKLDGT